MGANLVQAARRDSYLSSVVEEVLAAVAVVAEVQRSAQTHAMAQTSVRDEFAADVNSPARLHQEARSGHTALLEVHRSSCASCCHTDDERQEAPSWDVVVV